MPPGHLGTSEALLSGNFSRKCADNDAQGAQQACWHPLVLQSLERLSVSMSDLVSRGRAFTEDAPGAQLSAGEKGEESGSGGGGAACDVGEKGAPRVVISGHSHKASLCVADNVLFVNAGSAGPRRFSLPKSAVLLHMLPNKSIHARIVEW